MCEEEGKFLRLYIEEEWKGGNIMAVKAVFWHLTYSRANGPSNGHPAPLGFTLPPAKYRRVLPTCFPAQRLKDATGSGKAPSTLGQSPGNDPSTSLAANDLISNTDLWKQSS